MFDIRFGRARYGEWPRKLSVVQRYRRGSSNPDLNATTIDVVLNLIETWLRMVKVELLEHDQTQKQQEHGHMQLTTAPKGRRACLKLWVVRLDL